MSMDIQPVSETRIHTMPLLFIPEPQRVETRTIYRPYGLDRISNNIIRMHLESRLTMRGHDLFMGPTQKQTFMKDAATLAIGIQKPSGWNGTCPSVEACFEQALGNRSELRRNDFQTLSWVKVLHQMMQYLNDDFPVSEHALYGFVRRYHSVATGGAGIFRMPLDVQREFVSVLQQNPQSVDGIFKSIASSEPDPRLQMVVNAVALAYVKETGLM